MDHRLLKQAWAKLIDNSALPKDHYNVFKAATKFSYILRDDLRIRPSRNGRKSGFDERNLAEIRKENNSAFFKNAKSLHAAINAGKLRIYKNEFKNSECEMIGIPQGLPISAMLANLYLLEFDKAVLKEVIDKQGGYYRRYSDDIIVICKEENKNAIIDFIDRTLRINNKVEISKEKTEQYYFSVIAQADGTNKNICHLLKGEDLLPERPLTYLGFEFYGHKTLIKSANLSKFYRRMIIAVKSRSKRSILAGNKTPGASIALFRRRLYRLYTNVNLDKTTTKNRYKYLLPNQFGFYVYQTKENEDEFSSNYFTYGKRAADIMKEPKIIDQVRRHRTIFNQAMKKHLTLSIERFQK